MSEKVYPLGREARKAQQRRKRNARRRALKAKPIEIERQLEEITRIAEDAGNLTAMVHSIDKMLKTTCNAERLTTILPDEVNVLQDALRRARDCAANGLRTLHTKVAEPITNDWPIRKGVR